LETCGDTQLTNGERIAQHPTFVADLARAIAQRPGGDGSYLMVGDAAVAVLCACRGIDCTCCERHPRGEVPLWILFIACDSTSSRGADVLAEAIRTFARHEDFTEQRNGEEAPKCIGSDGLAW
jgi:hypothetical protein